MTGTRPRNNAKQNPVFYYFSQKHVFFQKVRKEYDYKCTFFTIFLTEIFFSRDWGENAPAPNDVSGS